MLQNLSLVKIILLVLVARGTCENIESILPRITNGINTVAGEAPSVVSIRVPLQAAQTAPHTYCSGTIINANHVITSVQCVHNEANQLINPFWFRIIAGDLNILIPSYRRFTTNATHIFTHPEYTISPRNNDIAVIRTSEPFPFPHNTIDWAVRNTHVLPNGQACRFIGWGSPALAGAITAAQQRVDVPILDRTLCNAAGVHNGAVLESMICAGSLTVTAPISGVCTGNLGGGLFCNVNNWWQFTGVLTFGIGCGVANNPGVYTQIRFYEEWINQQLLRTDSTPPGLLVLS